MATSVIEYQLPAFLRNRDYALCINFEILYFDFGSDSKKGVIIYWLGTLLEVSE